ncbi:hypothetical protein AVEN_231307-1 [Araneus ventricosus]|uniref:Uncharacterized protein n=1 Tax=Araneus ventricosus TaxID=182803 RepID=A0A4Y2CKL7_ARAVE|nr:hypothetical protein AVEN_231307-1 [Araneus ventricosus]
MSIFDDGFVWHPEAVGGSCAHVPERVPFGFFELCPFLGKRYFNRCFSSPSVLWNLLSRDFFFLDFEALIPPKDADCGFHFRDSIGSFASFEYFEL